MHRNLPAKRTQVKLPKSGKSRYVPITDVALAAFEYLIGNRKRGLAMLDPHAGGQLDYNRTYQASLAAGRAAKLECGDESEKLVSLHMLRHSFASHAIMAVVSLPVLQRWLGHATLQMTMVYAHLAPDHEDRQLAILNSHADSHIPLEL